MSNATVKIDVCNLNLVIAFMESVATFIDEVEDAASTLAAGDYLSLNRDIAEELQESISDIRARNKEIFDRS